MTLEGFSSRFIRDAAHEDPRVPSVADAASSVAGYSGCSFNGGSPAPLESKA